MVFCAVFAVLCHHEWTSLCDYHGTPWRLGFSKQSLRLVVLSVDTNDISNAPGCIFHVCDSLWWEDRVIFERTSFAEQDGDTFTRTFVLRASDDDSLYAYADGYCTMEICVGNAEETILNLDFRPCPGEDCTNPLCHTLRETRKQSQIREERFKEAWKEKTRKTEATPAIETGGK